MQTRGEASANAVVRESVIGWGGLLEAEDCSIRSLEGANKLRLELGGLGSGFRMALRWVLGMGSFFFFPAVDPATLMQPSIDPVTRVLEQESEKKNLTHRLCLQKTCRKAYAFVIYLHMSNIPQRYLL